METYEALAAAIDGKTKDVAKALHLAPITVNKWQEPTADYTDSGAFNRLDRVDTIIREALFRGLDGNKAYAPIFYLTEKYGLCCFPLVRKNADASDLTKDLIKTIEEFGHLTTAFSKAFNEDQNISREDAEKINKEGWELVNQVLHFLEEVNAAIDDRPFALRWSEKQCHQHKVVPLK